MAVGDTPGQTAEGWGHSGVISFKVTGWAELSSGRRLFIGY